MLRKAAVGGLGLGLGTLAFRKGEEVYWSAKEPWKRAAKRRVLPLPRQVEG